MYCYGLPRGPVSALAEGTAGVGTEWGNESRYCIRLVIYSIQLRIGTYLHDLVMQKAEFYTTACGGHVLSLHTYRINTKLVNINLK